MIQRALGCQICPIVMGLHAGSVIRCLGYRVEWCTREAEGDRHDQQAAKHEAKAGHGTILEVMTSNHCQGDLFPLPSPSAC